MRGDGVMDFNPVGASRAPQRGREPYASTCSSPSGVLCRRRVAQRPALRGAQGTARIMRGEAIGRPFLLWVSFGRTKETHPGCRGGAPAVLIPRNKGVRAEWHLLKPQRHEVM
jgi:hypothetical protein